MEQVYAEQIVKSLAQIAFEMKLIRQELQKQRQNQEDRGTPQ